MNAFRLFASCAVVLLVAACASAPASQAQTAGKRYQADSEYMAMVELIARRRGVDIEWVNPPKKFVEVPENADPAEN